MTRAILLIALVLAACTKEEPPTPPAKDAAHARVALDAAKAAPVPAPLDAAAAEPAAVDAAPRNLPKPKPVPPRATPDAGVATPPPTPTPPDAAPAPSPKGTPSASDLGSACAADGSCPAGLTCVSYYGVAGARGPEFKTCEMKCKSSKSCPKGTSCMSIADGPGQVCR